MLQCRADIMARKRKECWPLYERCGDFHEQTVRAVMSTSELNT